MPEAGGRRRRARAGKKADFRLARRADEVRGAAPRAPPPEPSRNDSVGMAIVVFDLGAPHHEPVARKRRNKLEGGKPALTLALSPRRGDGSGAFCWHGQPRCRSSGGKVQGGAKRELLVRRILTPALSRWERENSTPSRSKTCAYICGGASVNKTKGRNTPI